MFFRGWCLVLFLLTTVPIHAATWQEPAFADFPITEQFTGTPAPFQPPKPDDWQLPDDAYIQQRIREESQKPPNFAGVCRIVIWGCGTGCAQAALIDLRDGQFHFLFTLDSEEELAYRVDSRLFVLRPQSWMASFDSFWLLCDGQPHDFGSTSASYEWTGQGLRLIRKFDLCGCPEIVLQRIAIFASANKEQLESNLDFVTGLTFSQTLNVMRYLGFSEERRGVTHLFRRADLGKVLRLTPQTQGSTAALRQLQTLSRFLWEHHLWRAPDESVCERPQPMPTRPVQRELPEKKPQPTGE